MKKCLLSHFLLFLGFSAFAQFIEIDKGQPANFLAPDWTAAVAPTTAPQALPVATPPSFGGVDPELAAELQYVLDSMTAELGAVGLSASLVLPDGEVWNGASGQHNSAGDQITTGMRLGMGSVSKTLTSAVIMQLAEEGALTLDDTLGMWLPQYPNVDLGITVRMLLNHTSGIYNFTNNPAFSVYLNQNLSGFIDAETVMNTWVDLPSFQPGTTWGYSNTNYVLLGLIIESVTGNDYHQEVRDRLIVPNGLTSVYLHPQEMPTGSVSNLWLDLTGDGIANDFTGAGLSDVGLFSAAWAAGAYMTTAEDAALWIKYLMTGQVVEMATLDQMKETVAAAPNFNYGLGIYNSEINGNQWWGHDGYIYYQTLALYSPDLDVSMVLMCNDGLFQDMGLIYFSLIQTYLDFEPVAVEESVFAQQRVEVFPNPFTDEILIGFELKEATHAKLKVANPLGQVIHQIDLGMLQQGVNNVQLIGCGDWPKGMYSIHLAAGEDVVSKKIIRQ